MKSSGKAQTVSVRGFCAALALAVSLSPSLAQDFPSRPVTIVIPFTAGGPADTAARTISEVLRHHLGQPLIAENRPAASGVTGTEAVALGEADGYTLLLGGIAALVLVPPVQKVRYDVAKDFAPLGLIWRSPQVFAVSTKLGVNTVSEFVAHAKANPGKVTIGSAGNGTVTHLAGELLKRESGIELLHVPYRSTANSLTDLVGGHIDAIFGDVAILQPHVQSGAIRALAITSPERSLLLPRSCHHGGGRFPARSDRGLVWPACVCADAGSGAGKAEGRRCGRPGRSGVSRGLEQVRHQPGAAGIGQLREVHPR